MGARAVIEELEPGIRRIVAPNPGPMTAAGTNSYIVGADRLVVIDPGPMIAAHLEALRAAIGTAPVEAVVVTHAHLDHSGGARALAGAVGAPLLGYGPPEAGRSPVMAALAAAGEAGGGEGVDRDFAPDREIGEGDRVGGLRVLHTPGHFAGHLSLMLGDVLFGGDHLMGWATTLISPPDGDLRAFLASSERLAREGARVCHAGHGEAVRAPGDRLAELVAHRRARDRAILAALGDGPATAAALAARIYVDVAPGLLPAAARNVFAHLVSAVEDGRVAAEPRLSAEAVFRLA